METPLDRGHAFEAEDLWRDSCFATTSKPVDSIFGEINTKPLSPVLFSTAPDQSLFDLQLPSIDNNVESPAKSVHAQKESVVAFSDLKDDKVVDTPVFDMDPDDLEVVPLPPFYTWEARAGLANDGTAQPHFLSEAGPATFDAAYNFKGEQAILSRDYALQALKSLVLGRSSSLFQWSHATRAFQQIAGKTTLSGTSLPCSQDIIDELCAVGTALVVLRDFAVPHCPRNTPCSALVALQSCLLHILDAIEEAISGQLTEARTILQLQYAMTRPRNLLRLMVKLRTIVKVCTTNEAIISVVSDFVNENAELVPNFCHILRMVLSQVSIPWLEQLACDIGFHSSTDNLAGRPIDVESQHIDMRKFSFVEPRDAEIIEATKKALNIVQTHDPNNALVACVFGHNESPHASFVDLHLSRARISARAAKYKARMLESISQQRRRRVESENPRATSNPSTRPDYNGETNAQPWQLANIDELEVLMSRELGVCENDSSSILGRTVSLALKQSFDGAVIHDIFQTTPAPLERLRPFLEIQHRLVSGVVLRQVFRAHCFMDHLKLHRSFYLFGSGDFVAELSAALFSPELQSAERKRGAIPTSEQIGLRLGHGSGNNWPPASSELCLVLMGVLSRVAGMQAEQNKQHRLGRFDVQDGLNFAVRELPEAEIEQTLDMHSIHALDFLGLQYNAPAPLDQIITPEASKDYDSIFRFLLIAMRLLYITANLARSLAEPKGEMHDDGATRPQEVIKFTHMAHHLVTVILSHFMDVGIAAPWQDLLNTIQSLERDLEWEDQRGDYGARVHVGLEWLHQTHIACLVRIRGRLFMRNKQQKIRVALEHAFTSVLSCNHVLQEAGENQELDFSVAHQNFTDRFEDVCTVLQESVDKSITSNRTAEIEEMEVHRMLLTRLKWHT
jgi:hypothetical protein